MSTLASDVMPATLQAMLLREGERKNSLMLVIFHSLVQRIYFL